MSRWLPASTRAGGALVLLVATLATCLTVAAAGASSWLRTSADQLAEQAFATADHQATQLQVSYVETVTSPVPAGAADAVRGALSPTLREVLAAPRHAVATAPMAPTVLPFRPTEPGYLRVAGFPDVEGLVEVVTGRMPRPGSRVRALPAQVAAAYDGPLPAPVVEVVLADEAARAMNVAAGSWFSLSGTSYRLDRDRPAVLHVVGTYRATTPYPSPLDDVPTAREPAISVLPDANVVRATALAADEATVLEATWLVPPDLLWTFDLARNPGAERAPVLVREARRAVLQAWPPVVQAADARAATGLGDVAEGVVERRSASDGALSMVLSGLAGAGLAVLLAAALALAGRRREVTEVVRARGASAAWLLTARGGEALVLVAPGVLVVGAAAPALAVVGGREVLVALATALACGALVTGAQVWPRTTGSGVLGAVARDGAQLALVALAAVVTGLALRGGPGTDDPVVLLAPPLLGAAAAVLLVRLLGPLLGWLRRLAGGSRSVGAVVTLGQGHDTARRAVLVAAALVLAAGSGLLALAVSDTLRASAVRAGWEQVGADVSVTAGTMRAETVAALDAVPGTDAVARVLTLDRVAVETPTGVGSVRVVATDPDRLQQVGDPSLAGLRMPRPDADVLEVVASSGLELGEGAALRYGQARVPLRVVDRVAALPGVTGDPETAADPAFVVVDLGAFAAATDRPLTSYDRVLVSGDPELAALAEVARERDPAAEVLGRDQVTRDRLDGPAVRRTQQLLLVAGVVAGVGTVFAVLLVAGIGGPARRRAAVVLDGLGAHPRHARRSGALALLPVLAAAALAAAACAVLLAAVVGHRFDLSQLTGTAADLPVRPSTASLAASLAASVAGGGALLALGLAAVAARTGSTSTPTSRRSEHG